MTAPAASPAGPTTAPRSTPAARSESAATAAASGGFAMTTRRRRRALGPRLAAPVEARDRCGDGGRGHEPGEAIVDHHEREPRIPEHELGQRVADEAGVGEAGRECERSAFVIAPSRRAPRTRSRRRSLPRRRESPRRAPGRAPVERDPGEGCEDKERRDRPEVRRPGARPEPVSWERALRPEPEGEGEDENGDRGDHQRRVTARSRAALAQDRAETRSTRALFVCRLAAGEEAGSTLRRARLK